MLSNPSPRASNAAVSSADNLKSGGVAGQVVVSAFDALVATGVGVGGAGEDRLPGPAGGGSPADAAGGAASEGSSARPGGSAAGEGKGSIRRSPSMREATSRIAVLPIDNPLLSPLSENSFMRPMAAPTGSAARFLCKTTIP